MPYNCVQIICMKNNYLKQYLFTKDYYELLKTIQQCATYLYEREILDII